MFGVVRHPVPTRDYSACTGCSLCLLSCPVWRVTHDIRLTPHGRAKALQHGATPGDLAASVESCTFCGACEPVCPENIDLIGMVVGLRQQLPRSPIQNPSESRRSAFMQPAPSAARNVLLSGSALRERPNLLARAAELLRLTVSNDDGADISLALETGANLPPRRIEEFVGSLRRQRRIVVGDGLLFRYLRSWLPRGRVTCLGAALSELSHVRQCLRPTDLYVIEPRAYHADYERQVRYYDALRSATGCMMNLDLQRVAIPATARSLPQRLDRAAPDDTAHVQWILHGRRVERIVVESAEDIRVFERVADCPVVHVADLLDASARSVS
jgi:ferredoxin